MTADELGEVLGAVLLRAFGEIRAATASAATDDKAPDATDVAGSARASPRPRFLKDEIVDLLTDGKMRTLPEIAEKAKGGIGARRGDVEACLLSNGHLFTSANGREVGRSPKATLWQLAESKATGAVLPPETAGTSRTSHTGRDGYGATRPGLGLVEHPQSSARLRTIELRVPTITLLIGSDER